MLKNNHKNKKLITFLSYDLLTIYQFNIIFPAEIVSSRILNLFKGTPAIFFFFYYYYLRVESHF